MDLVPGHDVRERTCLYSLDVSEQGNDLARPMNPMRRRLLLNTMKALFFKRVTENMPCWPNSAN
jgi:hypothetical protein